MSEVNISKEFILYFNNVTFKRNFCTENVTALGEDEKKSCDVLINKHECAKAPKHFSNNKPRAMMVCQLSYTVSFGQIFAMIYWLVITMLFITACYL